VIADLDTGVRFEHPDLQWAPLGRLLPGYDFITDVTTANDGDGRDPDASDPGDWVTAAEATQAPFKGNNCIPQGEDHVDSSWHGTRTAGILGALTNNGTGVAGITWQAWILPVRVLGKCGGSDSDILAAMVWAAGVAVDGVPNNPYPAQIINMSLGSTGSCPASYQDVINQLNSRGVLVVVSAGNEGGPVDAPANCAGVAGIAGLRQAGTKVGYSSLGHQVALSAPAGNCGGLSGPCLYSIDTTFNLGTTTPTTNGYTDQTNTNLGTSFSAPVVSAIAGLMLAVNGNLSSSQLIARLQEGSTPFPQSSLDAGTQPPPMCHDPTSATDLQQAECICTRDGTTCGSGMANAPGAIGAALRPIAAVKATYGHGGVVTLDASGSAAACNHSLTAPAAYQWTSSDPARSPVSAATGTSTTVTAPASGSISVTLAVTDDAGRSDTATVKLSATQATSSSPASAGNQACLAAVAVASPITVTISPTSGNLQAGSGTLAFAATVTHTLNTAVNWQVNGVSGGNATLGTISSAGLYTAPGVVAATTNVTVSAVSVADPTRMASAQVTVTGPPGSNLGASGGSTASGGMMGASSAGGSGGGGGALDALTLALGLLLAMLRGPVGRRRAG
jgi:serine protease